MPDPLDPPRPAGPYFSTWGPTDAPILRRDDPPALGVVLDRDEHMPISIAYPVGQVEHSFRTVQRKS